MNKLEYAIFLAIDWHSGQEDKSGEPYILHLLRVMQAVEGDDRIVAILHDSLEDGRGGGGRHVRIKVIREVFGADIATAIEAISRWPAELYPDYIERLKTNLVAREVKIADLYDNLDPRRMRVTTDEDLERVRKYHRALETLL